MLSSAVNPEQHLVWNRCTMLIQPGEMQTAHAYLRKDSPIANSGQSSVPANITIPKHQLVFLRMQPLRIIFSLLRECLLSFQERTPVNLSNLLLGASQTTVPVKKQKQKQNLFMTHLKLCLEVHSTVLPPCF